METTRGRAHLAAVLIGALVGIGLGALVGGIRHDALIGWVIGGAIVGAAAGALAAPWWWRRRAVALDPYVAALPEAERDRFYRQARRGPVPADPDRRAAAIRIMRRRMDATANNSAVVLLIGVFWPFYTVYFAFQGFWPLVAVGVLNIVATIDRWRAPRRAARRLAELRAYPDPADIDTAQSG